MIFITAYSSPSLNEDSHGNYQQSCITNIKITDTDDDLSASFNKHIHDGEDGYPTWDKLALCLRTDWKRLKCWSLAEGEVLTPMLKAELRKHFDRPEIISRIAARLEAYAFHFHKIYRSGHEFESPMKDLFCLNKHEFDVLQWGYVIVDQGSDDEGLEALREALVIGAVDEVIQQVRWNHYH